MGWFVKATPRPLYSREYPGTYSKGSWVGPRSGVDGWGKSRPTGGYHSRTKLLYQLLSPGPQLNNMYVCKESSYLTESCQHYTDQLCKEAVAVRYQYTKHVNTPRGQNASVFQCQEQAV